VHIYETYRSGLPRAPAHPRVFTSQLQRWEGATPIAMPKKMDQ